MGSTVDYSYGRIGGNDRSHLDAIAAAGYEGVCRYVSFDGWPKNLSKFEYEYALSIGLSVAVVWETTAAMMLRGAPGGSSDSYHANRQLDEIGFAGEDVFYAADFDANGAHFGTMEQYLHACSGRTASIYGEYDVIEHFVGGGIVPLGWQCAAWSGFGGGSGGAIDGRRLSRHACLFQRVGYVLGDTCDTNDIMRAYWGQSGAFSNVGSGAPVDNPNMLDIPTNPNKESSDMAEIKRLLIDENTGEVFQTYGIFKKYVQTEEDAQVLVGLGAIDARTDANGADIPGAAALRNLSLVP